MFERRSPCLEIISSKTGRLCKLSYLNISSNDNEDFTNFGHCSVETRVKKEN
jgi:hypothetical protein